MVSLFVGYAGYYFCRAFFASAKPGLVDEFGFDKQALGFIASVGTICYAGGKFSNTIVCDFVGGRRMFLLGMVGSAVATAYFGLASGFVALTVAWGGNRFLQSMGWGALVKIASRWVPFERYGSAMAALSLSFVLGDAAAKALYGRLLDGGLGWRSVCFVAAGILFAVFVRTLVRLDESPRDVGVEEPATSPANLFAEAGAESTNDSLRALLRPFAGSPVFWTILALSFGLTLIRDTFGEWLPLYLREVGDLSNGEASTWAALFPLAGAISILATGYASDRFLDGRRGGLMVVLLALAVVVLVAMSRLGHGGGAFLPIACSTLTAMLTLGPYSLLAGAIALDLGGRRGSATASGLIDGVGYLSGLVSGLGVGALAERSGWGAAFGTLAAAAFVTLLAAAMYWRLQEGDGSQR